MNNVQMWYERHLEMRKSQPAHIRFLLWVGFVKFDNDDRICWPFKAPPLHMFRHYLRFGPRVYRFRNLPGVIKWLPGRLLPKRWGFGILGFEFGDRG